MKDIILSNGRITAHTNAFGAELKGLEMDGLEYLWQGDPAYYDRTSPTIFPIMGRFLSDTYYVGDKAYHMEIGGFAKDRNFAVEEQSGDSVTFILCDDERTRKLFPFAFRLRVTYALEEKGVRVTYRLENPGDGPLPFCFACHTAYRWPLEGDDPNTHYLRFEKQEDIASFNPFNWKDPSFIRAGYRPLSHSLFENFTRSFTDIQSEYIEYGSTAGKHGVRIHRGQFPFTALWTMPDENARLICIEPATSVHAGGATTMEDRMGSLTVMPGESCERSFSIELF